MLLPSHGWLAKDEEAPSVVEGVSFDGTLPTRREEYNFLAKAAKEYDGSGYYAYDAATGYVPNWHVAPYILANLGWLVDAVDNDPRTFDMPKHPSVYRHYADMNEWPLSKDYVYDLIICISVLEHCDPMVKIGFVEMVYNCLRPGGVLIITADEIDPSVWPKLLGPGLDCGDLQPFDKEHLSPRVGYVVARRT